MEGVKFGEFGEWTLDRQILARQNFLPKRMRGRNYYMGGVFGAHVAMLCGHAKRTMSIYKYFKKDTALPSPKGPLSAVVPPDAIRSMNREVEKVIEQSSTEKRERGPYIKFTSSQRALIGKRAAEHGVTSSIRHFCKKYPEFSLKETTVRRLKNEYLAEIRKRRREDATGENAVTELPSKKRGRPTLLGKELEEKVKAYITVLREDGAVVNTKITIASTKGVILSHDANLLAANGGHIELTKHWAKSFLQRMGFVKRKGTTKSKVGVADFDAVKQQFLSDVKSIVVMDEIPQSLIINWDQTGVHYVPVSDWTMEKRGSKRIEIAGIDDKRQLTAVFACSMTGDFLSPQLVY